MKIAPRILTSLVRLPHRRQWPCSLDQQTEFSVAAEMGETLSFPTSHVGQGSLGLGHNFSLQTKETKSQRNPQRSESRGQTFRTMHASLQRTGHATPIWATAFYLNADRHQECPAGDAVFQTRGFALNLHLFCMYLQRFSNYRCITVP